ncbi:MAG: CinA family protein [Lachnospiraceae bacterium]|nr:CinA family protein [Lachnospiraceae bacterium]
MSKVEELVSRLIELKYTITTAESCTGGMISSALVDVSGASNVVNECHVTYSNEAKVRYLGVKEETLVQFGAVSEQTAYEMAKGASGIARADVAVGVTGLAGPGGGTEQKPVGLVYVGYCINGDVEVIKYNFSGNRTEIRKQTTKKVIEHLLELLG